MAEHYPFQSRAAYFHEQGLPVVPIRKDTKCPTIKWKHLQDKRQSEKRIELLIEQYPAANIAVVTGRISGLTVVDSDDPTLHLSTLYDRFGHTDHVTRTPRGGHHLYYRSNGEPTITGHDNGIDIRGEGGLIICPPSIGSNGTFYSSLYRDELDVRELVVMKEIITPKQIDASGCGIKGTRNKDLFNNAISHAIHCKSPEQLLAFLHEENARCYGSGLSMSALNAMARKVWEYKLNGTLFVGGISYILMPPALLDLEPCAHKVYNYLRSRNNNSDKEFPVSARACAATINMSPTTFRKAIVELEAAEILLKTHKGGSCLGDTCRYRWGQ